MPDLQHPWDIYARYQTKLSRSRALTDQTWGNEAALNRILARAGDGMGFTTDEASVAAASEARRERRHAFLRVSRLTYEPQSFHPEAYLTARQDMRAAEATVSQADWSLLCGLAAGHTYGDMALNVGGTPARLRLRALRVRQKLALLAA